MSSDDKNSSQPQPKIDGKAACDVASIASKQKLAPKQPPNEPLYRLDVRTMIRPIFENPTIAPDKKWTDQDTKAVDRYLIKKGLICLDIDEISRLRDFAQSCYVNTPHYDFPKTETLLATPENLVAFLFKFGHDAEFRGHALRDKTILSNTLSEPCGPLPADVKDACLRELWRKKHFSDSESRPLENFNTRPRPPHFPKLTPYHIQLILISRARPYNPKLEIAAYLAMRSMSREDLIEATVPALNFEEFHALQAKVFHEVEKALSSLAKRFLAFLPKLTELQREALQHANFENYKKREKKEIARELGITVKALEDRSNIIKRMMIAHFPDLTPVTKKTKDDEHKFYHQEMIKDDGLFRFETDIRHPVRQIKPATGEVSVIAPKHQTRYPKKATSQVSKDRKIAAKKALWARNCRSPLNGSFFDEGQSILVRPERIIQWNDSLKILFLTAILRLHTAGVDDTTFASLIDDGQLPPAIHYNEAAKREPTDNTKPTKTDYTTPSASDEKTRVVKHLQGFSPTKHRMRMNEIRMLELWAHYELNGPPVLAAAEKPGSDDDNS